MSKELDATDREILRHLQGEARMTNTELAQRVQLSPPGLQKRLRKLEEARIIQGYAALLDREALGYDMLCFVQVTLRHHEPATVDHFKQAVQTMPEVLECYHLTGDYDYLLKVVIQNRKHLERFLLDTLTPVPGIDKIHTSVVLNEIKATTALPLQSHQE